jgi:hypothetical protein
VFDGSQDHKQCWYRFAIREEIRAEALRLREEDGIVPGLTAIIVGKNPASVAVVGFFSDKHLAS